MMLVRYLNVQQSSERNNLNIKTEKWIDVITFHQGVVECK